MKTEVQEGKHRYLLLAARFLSWGLVFVVAAGMLSGCRSRDQYKALADKEVYQILQNKWQDQFGEMGNYQINEPNVSITEALPPSRELKLAEAVAVAVSYSREYQTQKESLYRSALSLTGTRHQYARQWFGTIDADYALRNGSDNITANSSAGVNQDYLIGNGIQVATGLAVDWSRFLTGDPRTSLGSVLSATITAPILGAGAGMRARETLTLAERGVLYDIRSFSRQRKTFVISIISDYYNVLQQRDSVAIQESSYKRLIDSTNQLRMEVDVGQRAPYDLGEAEQRLLTAENNLVRTRQRYEQTLDEFKVRLALPTEVDIALAQGELAALEEMGVSLPAYTEQDAIEMALDRRLDLANTVDSLDDAARNLELAGKGLGMQLDLIASANADSMPPTQAARIQFHEGTYGLGLSANLPLDRKSERNAYLTALISYNRQKRTLEEQIETVKLGVRQSYRDLAETAESHRIQMIGYDLAVKRVEVEKLSLKYGRGTVRLLLESEDALVSARNSVVAALVNHMIAKLNFFRDIGVLQVRPDGMWEQVTQ
ncbi:MAG: TolC family protein [Phycisphaerae bacterium]|nr:TolC family protein [Phycisphaerae bacterium]